MRKVGDYILYFCIGVLFSSVLLPILLDIRDIINSYCQSKIANLNVRIAKCNNEIDSLQYNDKEEKVIRGFSYDDNDEYMSEEEDDYE